MIIIQTIKDSAHIHLVEFGLELPLGSGESLVDVGRLGELLVRVGEILLGGSPVPVCALQEGPG